MQSDDPSFNPVDSALNSILEGIRDWQKQNTPESIKRTVKVQLDKAAKEVTLKLLGFDVRYSSGWELDHCNGRSGNSPAGGYIKQHAEKAVSDWLTNLMMPTLTPDEHARLSANLHKEYVTALQYQLRDQVKARAVKDAAALLDAISTSNKVDNYGKLLALLTEQAPPPPTTT